ncbi:hypothetical protein C8F01DRAFT_1134882 [Mycena amicta]|nr:hypothetical protein C8F01DRAFT_1134882 [Mycena amicta]
MRLPYIRSIRSSLCLSLTAATLPKCIVSRRTLSTGNFIFQRTDPEATLFGKLHARFVELGEGSLPKKDLSWEWCGVKVCR